MDRKEFAKRLYSIIVPEGISEKERQELVLPNSEAIVQMMPNLVNSTGCYLQNLKFRNF